MPNVNLTKQQYTTVLRAMGMLFRAGTLESDEYLGICNPILEATNRVEDPELWHHLPPSMQDTLAVIKIEEIQEAAKDLAHIELDKMLWPELAGSYGIDPELVHHFAMSGNPVATAEMLHECDMGYIADFDHVTLWELQSLQLFDVNWNPTKDCRDYLIAELDIKGDDLPNGMFV